MENIMLSICMIVKNEERCLERCLKSLTPLREQIPCEVIVTDTGSTDRTLEIAEKYADKILHFEWCNDFSAARNVGMEEAKGEWIMVIDADEEMVEDVSHLVKFFNSEERHKYVGGFLKKKNCSDIKLCRQCESLKDYDGISSDFLDYRLFRADLKPRYVGIIHEAVPHREPTYIFGLTLYHDGYAFEDISKRKEKGKRNASLLEKQIKENMHDLRAITHVLREEDVLDKEVYRNLILLTEDLMYKNLRSLFSPYSFAKVADYYSTNHDIEKALQICKDFLKYYGDERCELFEIDIRFIQSKCLFEQKQYRPALKMMDRYFELIEKYDKEEMSMDLLKTATPIYNNKSVREYLKHLQIQCYVELKDIKKAGELLKEIDLEKVSKTGFYNFFITVIRFNHIREANISLVDYYPILSRAMKSEDEEIQQSAKQVFDTLQKHINSLPDKVRQAVFRQIASSEEGKQDLNNMAEKAKEEKKQKEENLKKVIEDTKVTIRKLIAQQNMKEKALDLAKRLEEITPEDEEVKQFIKELSK